VQLTYSRGEVSAIPVLHRVQSGLSSASSLEFVHIMTSSWIDRLRMRPKIRSNRLALKRTLPVRLIGNYLTTDQVLAVGGIQFQSEPLRKRNHLVELRMLHHATVTMSR
jgi:hypothetical protein